MPYVKLPTGPNDYVYFPDDATPQEIEETVNNLPTVKAWSDVQGQSGLERFARGIGHSMAETGRGAAQLLEKAGKSPLGYLPLVQAGAQLAKAGQGDLQSLDQQEASARVRAKPLLDTSAGGWGNFTGGLAQAAGIGALTGGVGLTGAAGAIAGGATVGAAQGAMTPTVGDESTLYNTVEGAGLGALGGTAAVGLGKVAQRIARPFTDRLSDVFKRHLQTLATEGVPVDSAQMTGSAAARGLKALAGDSPFTPGEQFPQMQRQKFTQAVLKYMGIDGAQDASTATLDAGRQALQDGYDEVAGRTGVPLTQQLAREWQGVRQVAANRLTGESKDYVERLLTRVADDMNAGNGSLNGDQYKSYMSEILDYMKSGPAMARPVLGQVRAMLNGAMTDSAAPEDVLRLQMLDQRYAAFRAIEKATTSDDMINAKKLKNALEMANNNVKTNRTNQQDLYELAKAGDTLLGRTLSVPDSGTPRRGLMSAVGSGLMKPVNMATNAATGNLAQRLIYSPGGRGYVAGSIRAPWPGTGRTVEPYPPAPLPGGPIPQTQIPPIQGPPAPPGKGGAPLPIQGQQQAVSTLNGPPGSPIQPIQPPPGARPPLPPAPAPAPAVPSSLTLPATPQGQAFGQALNAALGAGVAPGNVSKINTQILRGKLSYAEGQQQLEAMTAIKQAQAKQAAAKAAAKAAPKPPKPQAPPPEAGGPSSPPPPPPMPNAGGATAEAPLPAPKPAAATAAPAPEPAPTSTAAAPAPANAAASPPLAMNARGVIKLPENTNLAKTSALGIARDALANGQATTVTLKDGSTANHVHMELPGGRFRQIYAFDKDGKNVGELSYGLELGSKPNVAVDAAVGRNRIATSMYAAARKAGGHIPPLNDPTANRSAEGQLLREGMERNDPAAARVLSPAEMGIPPGGFALQAAKADLAKATTPAERAAATGKIDKHSLPEGAPSADQLAKTYGTPEELQAYLSNHSRTYVSQLLKEMGAPAKGKDAEKVARAVMLLMQRKPASGATNQTWVNAALANANDLKGDVADRLGAQARVALTGPAHVDAPPPDKAAAAALFANLKPAPKPSKEALEKAAVAAQSTYKGTEAAIPAAAPVAPPAASRSEGLQQIVAAMKANEAEKAKALRGLKAAARDAKRNRPKR